MKSPLLCSLGVLLGGPLWALAGLAQETRAPRLVVGSKSFTESVILGEALTLLWRDAGFEVRHLAELGGTPVLWNALLGGELDAYVEYTGTLLHETLSDLALPDDAALRAALAQRGVIASRPLGFNNTYALGMRAAEAARLSIASISDLAEHPDLELGFTSEFLDRADGWPALRAFYDLPHGRVRGLNHDLAYRALVAGHLAVVDVYSTDADVLYYELQVLRDDRGFFPRYDALLLLRADLAERAPRAIERARALEGRIDDATMLALNGRAKLEGASEARVAADFLGAELGLALEPREPGLAARLASTTADHLKLVVASLACALAAAIPLGIAAARRPGLGRAVLGLVGVVQTIPSLALFVFLIPLFGLGAWPAIVALFLYSLLPIVRGTHAGLTGIPAELREAARALGLPPRARLWRVELPLALRSILSGVQTAAVINVGTATIAAFIGAPGYGQPIMTGIRRDDLSRVMEGAVPAALLALVVQGLFEWVERRLVSPGLTLGSGNGSA